MANYPQVLAQDAVRQSHTGHMTGLWFLPARPLRLNTNEWMNEFTDSDMFQLLEAIFRLITGLERNGDALPKNYKLLTL
jgi:hypothetical protein